MSTTSSPQRSHQSIACARLGIQPPGKMYLRIQNSVSFTPTCPMKWITPSPPGVLERADREQLVELPRHFPKIALQHFDFSLEAAALDLLARLSHLLGGGEIG